MWSENSGIEFIEVTLTAFCRSTYTSLTIHISERTYKMECTKCGDTGVIETGNNDLPCDCSKGDGALFNSAFVTGGPITGAQVKRHFLNGSLEPISHTVHVSNVPKST